MTDRERTLQQLHPLGTLATRPITLVAAASLPIYASVMTWLNGADIRSTPLAALALIAITASGVILVVGSRPLVAPFTRAQSTAAVGAALVALTLSVASTWTLNSFVRDDWAAPAIGLVLLALAPFRPASWIVLAGLLSAGFAGVLAAIQSPWFVTPVPPTVFVVTQTVPVVALALASAAFSRSLVRGLERWSEQATTAVSALGDSRVDWIARSVQQDRVTILGRAVIPYFASVVQSGEVTAESRERAREIADSIRSVMVADIDRSWLDGIVEQAAMGAGVAGRLSSTAVIDAAGLVTELDIDRRTALRALVVALFSHPDFSPSSLQIRVIPDGERVFITLNAAVDCSGGRLRTRLEPYFAVMRILFPDSVVAFDRPSLRLRFSYEQ